MANKIQTRDFPKSSVYLIKLVTFYSPLTKKKKKQELSEHLNSDLTKKLISNNFSGIYLLHKAKQSLS